LVAWYKMNSFVLILLISFGLWIVDWTTDIFESGSLTYLPLAASLSFIILDIVFNVFEKEKRAFKEQLSEGLDINDGDIIIEVKYVNKKKASIIVRKSMKIDVTGYISDQIHDIIGDAIKKDFQSHIELANYIETKINQLKNDKS